MLASEHGVKLSYKVAVLSNKSPIWSIQWINIEKTFMNHSNWPKLKVSQIKFFSQWLKLKIALFSLSPYGRKIVGGKNTKSQEQLGFKLTGENTRGKLAHAKTSHIWMLYFDWLQSQHYESSDFPNPPLQAALSHSPLLYGSRTFTHLKENSSVVKLPYLC